MSNEVFSDRCPRVMWSTSDNGSMLPSLSQFFFLLKEKLRSKISQRKIAFSAFCTALCIRQFTICIKVHFLFEFLKVDIWLSRQEKDNLLLVLKVGPEFCNLNWSQVCIWMSWVQVICFDSRSGESPNSFFSFQLIIYGLWHFSNATVRERCKKSYHNGAKDFLVWFLNFWT